MIIEIGLHVSTAWEKGKQIGRCSVVNLCYVMLCCVVLCCVMLCCAMLCYVMVRGVGVMSVPGRPDSENPYLFDLLTSLALSFQLCVM